MVRFVVFVHHPQNFLYASGHSEGGRRFRQTKGRIQDLHLSVAARLGGIFIDEQFYEVTHKVGTYGRLFKWQILRQKELNK